MSAPPAELALVLFDMDGVIFEGRSFWLDLHRRFGTEAEALELVPSLRIDYERVARYTVEHLWKGRPAAPLLELVAARRYQPGVADLCAALRARGQKTAIVSSGPVELAERAQRDLGFDAIRANRVLIADGRIAGAGEVAVSNAKLPVGLELIASLGATPARTAFIGDTESDASLAAAVALPIAYDSDSPALDRVARIRVARGQLATLIGRL